jgi:hypothetical protein
MEIKNDGTGISSEEQKRGLMMGVKRVVDIDFWNDDKVMDMFSPEDKLFMLYLLTNPHTTQLGIYAINQKHMSFELGYTREVISVLLDRFENKYEIIKYSKKTNEIAIKNFLKHSIIKGGSPVKDCLVRELKAVKDKALITFSFSHIKQQDNINKTVKTLIAEYEEKNGEILYSADKRNFIINENDNENENDVSYHDSWHESLKPKKTVKHKYGEYKNVMLSDDDMDKLKAEFPSDFQERIERLSCYKESTGKSYKNDLATIRNWARKDTKPQEEPTRYGGTYL